MPTTTENTAVNSVVEFFSKLTENVAVWQVLLAALVLLILVIILICALGSKNRKFDDLLEEKEKQGYQIERTERETKALISEKEAELSRKAAAKEQEMQKRADELDAMTEKLRSLERFHDEYSIIPNAQAEAGRIIREAKDHAYMVSSRTEMEYAEIIEHANSEAEAMRELAQQRLARSHDALKQALKRANEIIEDAHAEAGRIAQIAYTPGPTLIEAPADKPAEEAVASVEATETEDAPETTVEE